jgi:hypothetical protein
MTVTDKMSAEGRALVTRAHPRLRRTNGPLFDVLATLEHDLKAALDGKSVLVADWVSFMRRSDANKEAVIRALFLLIATGGLSSKDVRALRIALSDTSVRQRRPVKVIHQPRERQSKGLF